MPPQRFHAVSLAIPHLGGFCPAKTIPSRLLYSWYIFSIAALADWAVKRNDWALIRLLWRRWSPTGRRQISIAQCDLDLQSSHSVASAALGYYRSMFRLWSAEQTNARVFIAIAHQGAGAWCWWQGRTMAVSARTCLNCAWLPVRCYPALWKIKQLPGLGHFLP